MQNKQLMRLFFILSFVFLSSGAYLLLPGQPKKIIAQPTAQTITWSGVTTDTLISDDKPTVSLSAKLTPLIESKKETTDFKKTESPTTAISTTEPIKPEEIKSQIDITIEINNIQYPLQLSEKSTPFDAMEKLITDKKITATLKEFSGIGYFLEEINGHKNNNQTGEYWIYYINGQSAKIGISSYILKQNDVIKWKYEHSKF